MDIRDRWIGLIHRASSGTKKVRILLTPVGLVVFGIFTGLFIFLSILIDRWLSLPWLLNIDLSRLIAVPLITIGLGVIAWSAFHFLKMKGTPVPFNPPPKLVMTGPYRFARNPMLTGVFLSLFGIGFAIQSLSLVALFTPLYILINLWELNEIEEPELVKRLGEDYVAYRRRTPMFIPGIRIKKG